MNKFTLAFALGTGLTLSLAAPPVQADPMTDTVINKLATPSISASQFSDIFKPIVEVKDADGKVTTAAAPAMQSNFSSSRPTPAKNTKPSRLPSSNLPMSTKPSNSSASSPADPSTTRRINTGPKASAS